MTPNTQAAQRSWETRSVAERIKVLRAARKLIATRAEAFGAAVALPGRRNEADTIVAEVIPLLAAIRFLEREAATILKARRVGRRGRPLWLSGITSEIRRDPFGVVLVIAPFNYPLFLPGVQAVQALAAGNAVKVKPAPGHSAPMRLLAECLYQAGLPQDLFVILDETIEAAQNAIAGGVDKIVFTGSVAAGKAVLAQAAETLTPAIVELSGHDAVFVLTGTDLAVVARALAYGLCLNGSATCIAPRRVFLPPELIEPVADGLEKLLADRPCYPVADSQLHQIQRWLDEARKSGARIIGGVAASMPLPHGRGREAYGSAISRTGEGVPQPDSLPQPTPSSADPGGSAPSPMREKDLGGMTPAIVIGPPLGSALLTEDLFAPILSLIPVDSPDEALALAARCPFALGASVFGPAQAAQDFAARVDAGIVVVNDLIAPTADPRLPFEARRRSGFGATRGREGLLEMTRSRVISRRGNRFYFHYRKLVLADAGLFAAYAALANAGTGGVRLCYEVVSYCWRFAKRRGKR